MDFKNVPKKCRFDLRFKNPYSPPSFQQALKESSKAYDRKYNHRNIKHNFIP